MFPIHHTFPKEMPIIGRILVDYGELELDLMNCVQVARARDLNSTLKTMFKIRGEASRIQIADALARVPYTALGLGSEFEIMINSMDHCRKIRNKYAHAYWHDPDMGKALCYVSLEELAKEDVPVNDLTNLTFFSLDEPLLLEQEAYFDFVRKFMMYLNYEGRFRSNELEHNSMTAPPMLQKPQFYTWKG